MNGSLRERLADACDRTSTQAAPTSTSRCRGDATAFPAPGRRRHVSAVAAYSPTGADQAAVAGRPQRPGRAVSWALSACVCAVLVLGRAPSDAAQPAASGGPVSSPVEQADRRARDLLAEGRVSEAISWLKTAIEQHPSEASLRWLLARAYLLDNNELWALRSLGALVELRPEDCEPRSWIAWIQIRQGLPAEARESLSAVACEPGTPAEVRRTLLAAVAEDSSGDHEQGHELFERARQAPAAYAEDRVALVHLAPRLAPGYVAPLVGRLDLDAGWASNARAGSPTDPATGVADASSPVVQANAWLRRSMAKDSTLRPSLEAQVRALGFLADAGSDYSYLMLGARPGFLAGRGETSLLVVYNFETLLLAGGDALDPGPVWYYNAHRGELELDLPGSAALFGGAGRRIFRESTRTRTEIDAGIGASLAFGDRASVLGALAVRRHDTGGGPYDLWGGSLLVSSELRLPKRWYARLGAVVALDDYPRSAGYFDPSAGGVLRRDTLLKLSASGFAPPLRNRARVGFSYEYAQRFSTTDPYDYQDHRLLLKLIWPVSHDPSMPRAVTPAGHVPLEYGFSEAGLEERIQDLLRQDEATRGCSSCVE